MTEQNDNNLEVPEELESINHQPETESPSKQHLQYINKAA